MRAAVGPVLLTFAISACVMILEIVAGRIAARHVGNSIYTWTSIIAVVLAGISIGNVIGGWCADRFVRAGPRRVTASALALGAVLSLTILWTHTLAFDTVLGTSWAWPTKVLLGVALTFLPPSIVLGSLSPILASWVLGLSQRRGGALGTVYAAGATGSIVGTLLAGFVLIPAVGTSTIVAAVAVLLVLLAFFLWPSAVTAASAAVVVVGVYVAGLPPGLNGLLDRVVPRSDLPVDAVAFEESAYQTITVRYTDGEYVLVMDDLIHGYVDPIEPSRLTYEYLRIYRDLLDRRFPANRGARTLHLGAGAFTFPRYVSSTRPLDRLTVVEIDPAVTRVNQEHLRLGQPVPFEIVHGDARRVVVDLAAEGRTYDAAFVDAYQGFAVPYHLSTHEFFVDLRQALSDDGFVAANVIDVFLDGRVLSSLYNTVAAVFEHAYVIATRPPGLEESRDTFVVVGSRSSLGDVLNWDLPSEGFYVLSEPELKRVAAFTRGLVLTDEYAPIDNFVATWLR